LKTRIGTTRDFLPGLRASSCPRHRASLTKTFLYYLYNMLPKIISFCYLLFAPVVIIAQQKPKAIPVIFDTDMGPDYDDVGAITLLHAFADSGYAKILATVASTKYEGVAAVLNVFNTYFKKPGIPIGVPKGKALELKDKQHWTDTLIKNYPHKIKSNDEAPDAIAVYRKVLASQPDTSVTVITVGFVTNLAGLLQSQPDRYSKLTGIQLVEKKVKKLVCMAGRFPQGSEFNLDRDAASSIETFNNWPTTVFFSGFEIGHKIRTGLPLINNDKIRNSPVKDVFRISIPLDPQDSLGRMSWDETAVLVAIKGYQPWYNLQQGKIIINQDGSNGWNNEPSSHYHLVELESPATVQQLINKLIMHQPLKNR
jgi:pyrimidine-specific ribonucleoside hydrolase